MPEIKDRRFKSTMGSFIFLSRWLQAPLYFGLIVAQAFMSDRLTYRPAPAEH